MTIGNVLGGRISDVWPRRTMKYGFLVYMASLVAFPLCASTPVGLFVSAGLIGLTQAALTPAIQTRLIAAAGDAALLGAATNHAAFNVGNSLGAALGGAVIAAGFGYLAPGWVGVGLAVLGFALLGVSLVWERRAGGLRAVRAEGGKAGQEQPAA